MKKTVRIEGLDCPNCARALEGEIIKLKGINDVKIDFVTSSLAFDSEDVDSGLKEIVKLTKKLEPNAKIYENKEKNGKKVDKKLIFNVIFIILGIAIGLIALLVKMPTWAYWVLYVTSALLLGYQTYYKAAVLLSKGVINENLLITLSVIGASFVSEHMEGLMVIALYSIGKIFEGLAVGKSRKSIENLARVQPQFAVVVKENGEEERVAPQDVAQGCVIVVRAGEKVAIDGVIVEGESDFNTQSLTGESLPVRLGKGQTVLSGSIALDGVVKIKTTSLYKDSTISRIMQLVEHAQENKSKTETFISKLTKYYTMGIIAIAIIVWAIVWAVTGNFSTALYRGLIFLVVSCPCAFAISVPLTYFSGLGNASRQGILIKGSNFLDACTRLNLIAFDKTGTLTTGQFSIDKITLLNQKMDEKTLLNIAASGEQFSLHPLAKAIVEEAKKNGFGGQEVENFKEIAGKGVTFTLKNQNYFVGRRESAGKSTLVEVFENDEKIGEILMSDSIKESSFSACEKLHKLGIKTVLLSGDNLQSVEGVAAKLQIDEQHCQLLPQDKYDLIEKFKKEGKVIGYVGDGINDAPSLSRADVGISMGINGSPASIEASDIVLVDDNPEKIVSAIKISKRTRKIVLENIILSAIVKIVFLTLGAIGVTGMLSAVFADVGVTLLAILNSMRALRGGGEN